MEKAGGKIVAVNAYNKAEVIIDSEQGLQERSAVKQKSKQQQSILNKTWTEDDFMICILRGELKKQD